MKTVRFRVLLAVSALLVIVAALVRGCGGDTGPEKVGVNGFVSVDDSAVVEGTIMFVSLEGGRTCATSITDGAYELRRGSGPLIGPQKVTILAFEKTGQTITVTKSLPAAPDEGSIIPVGGIQVEEKRQILPARYNTESELTAELVSGTNSDVDFDLTCEGTPPL